MRIGKTFFCLVLLLSHLAGQPTDFPGSGFAEGWEKKGVPLQFRRNGLYGYINGGSELFLELGFLDLAVQRYARRADELSVEAFRMESGDAALGIYLMKCGRETPLAAIPTRNTGDQYQIMALKGNFFILVNNYTRRSSLLPVMVKLANLTLAEIPRRETPDHFSTLPRENLVPGSERLIRGMYGLQSIYTLGEGDILLLGGKIFGVTGDYKGEPGETYTRILIPYPSGKYARKVYSHLLANLDPYLEIVHRGQDHFTFQDYRKKFGAVRLSENRLYIEVNLARLRHEN